MNPLLDTSGLPRFSEIRAEHVAEAVGTVLEENRALVARLSSRQTPAIWSAFVAPLDDANERLTRVWGPVSHLHSVLDSPDLRAAYNGQLSAVTQYWAEQGQHEGLFRQYRALRDGPEFSGLSDEQRRAIENELRDFRLGGAELLPAEKARFLTIQEELASLGARFEENLLDATNAWTRIVSRAELAGVPEDAVAMLEAAARADGLEGCKLSLRAPCYIPVMQYGANRDLREAMYRAHVTRASEFGPPDKDNTALIADILRLRHEAACLLGYPDYAELSLATKMATSPAQVMRFLRDLAQRARPFAGKDHAELREFAARELGLPQLEAWDIAYASEKLREARYAFSENEVRQYFQEPRVLAGLFGVIETLYGLRVRPDHAPVWHPDVRFYALEDRSGQTVGRFYLDLYARETKRGGAWMDEAVTRRRTAAGIQTPAAYLNCNFTPPVSGKPALFSHDDVITLFHEFGHGLHHLLTRCETLGVSGISGVEWDAVELPSQFMENFCWEWPVLQGMTAHIESGDSLPRELFDKMIAAKNFQSGLQMLRQVEFALFDMRLHAEYDPAYPVSARQKLDEVRAEVAVLQPPEFNRFQNGFSHIFAGGYSAGYYSYKWAEVLSADAYGQFEEAGGINPESGQRFWDEILAVGGSRDALDSFRAFRGRDPSIDALLRHSGLLEVA